MIEGFYPLIDLLNELSICLELILHNPIVDLFQPLNLVLRIRYPALMHKLFLGESP